MTMRPSKSPRKSRQHKVSRSRKGRSAPGKRFGLICAMVLLPLFVLGAGFYGLNAKLTQKQMDPLTACYAQEDQAQSAVFIDFSLTHQTSTAQNRDLKTALIRAYEALPPNGKLSIFTTAQDSVATLTEPILSLCSPPATPAEQAALGAPDKPQPFLKRRAQEAKVQYEAHIAQLMEDAKDKSKVAKDSPILEQIQAISRYQFSGPLTSFYVFTDGVQNSEVAQFCAVKNHLPPFAVFERGPVYQVIKPDPFTDVRVEFLLIEGGALPSPSLPFCTHGELQAFWPAFFEASGATVRLTRLRYGTKS